MDKDLLIKIGLSEGEALVYGYLLENGESTAGQIIKKLPLKRGLVYNILKNMVQNGLVQQFEKNKVANFRLEHPSKLQNLIQKKFQETSQTQEILKNILPLLASQYTLVHHRPTVHYFEGLEGIEKVLEDSLTSKTEILSYADIESINKYIAGINKSYVKKREKLGIKKRGILLDTSFTRKFLKDYYTTITETRLIKSDAPPFHSIMQIYDNKVSYITLCEEAIIGVIIENHDIYDMHRYLFDALWQNATELKEF